MATAKRDENRVPTLIGVSTADGTTSILLEVDPNTGALITAHGKTLLSTGGQASGLGNNTLVSAGTSRLKVYAFSLTVVSTTQVTCIWQSGASGTEIWRNTFQT
ncbi:MAG TPA: hypothetical protein VFF49_01385, partial [Thermodesulfobacteriota bacterium]|nr:hypothetical protein [Thermodesulfobacteriota bacterium]